MIPIVMTQDDDPVATGFVASLARPGGNITGLSTLAPERSGKRLELLKEIVPRLSRVAVFGTSTEPSNAQTLKVIELDAGPLGIKLQYRDVLSLKDIGNAFRAAVKERAGAVLMEVSGPITNSYRKEIADLAVKSRLPVIYGRREPAEAGGLMSYGVSVEIWTDVPQPMWIRSKGRKACGSPSGTTEEVRIHHQFESRQADRVNNSSQCAG